MTRTTWPGLSYPFDATYDWVGTNFARCSEVADLISQSCR
jgi:hypothetical protein